MKYLHKSRFFAFFLFVSLVSFLSLACLSSVEAEDRMPELKLGMTRVEVIKLWGSPEEKIEKEIKRKDIWLYKNKSKVFFDNGTVSSVTNSSGTNILLPENREVKVEAKPLNQNSGTAVANQDVVDDILSEIMKDPSNSDASDSPGGIRPAAPVMPNVINAVPPPEVIPQ